MGLFGFNLAEWALAFVIGFYFVEPIPFLRPLMTWPSLQSSSSPYSSMGPA